MFRGDAGAGKTSLCEAAVEKAVGMMVLTAQGVESEAHLPFAGLLQLLRPIISGVETSPPYSAGRWKGR